MRLFLLCLVSVLLPGSNLSAELVRTSTPNDAVILALTDLHAIESAALTHGLDPDMTRYRYIWTQSGDMADYATIAFTVNAVISRTDINYSLGVDSPIAVTGAGQLVRLDLGRLCPDTTDREAVAALWDKMLNPYFMVTQNVHFFDKEKTLAPVFGPHVDAQVATELQAKTGANSPIVAAHSLHISALTTVNGGLYYKFKDLPQQGADVKNPKKSDFDLLMDRFDVPEEVIKRQRADEWTGQLRSNVTSRPRRTVFFNRAAPLSVSQGWISITYDTIEENRSALSHPLLSLLEFNHDGAELIAQQNNGHLIYALYDGTGKLIDEAPPQLVSDRTVPAPHSTRLQPGISCIRCHGGEGEQGWKQFSNDVKDVISIQGMDIVADATALNLGLSNEQTMELLARLYNKNLVLPLQDARNNQARTMAITTHGAMRAETNAPWDYSDVSKSLTNVFEDYYYDMVSPIAACRDLGYELTDMKEATELFNALTQSYVRILGGHTPTDFRILMLQRGRSIVRRDWDIVFIDAARLALFNENYIRGLNQ